MTAKSTGKCKVDGISIGEISIDLFKPSTTISAKYALCNMDSGARFGAGNRNSGWSEATVKKLDEFIAALEVDILQDVFEGGNSTTASVDEFAPSLADEIPSL